MNSMNARLNWFEPFKIGDMVRLKKNRRAESLCDDDMRFVANFTPDMTGTIIQYHDKYWQIKVLTSEGTVGWIQVPDYEKLT